MNMAHIPWVMQHWSFMGNFHTYQWWTFSKGTIIPNFSLMVDEATNLTLEQHLVVYFSTNWKLPQITRFVELLSLEDGTTQSTWYMCKCHMTRKNVTNAIFSNTR